MAQTCKRSVNGEGMCPRGVCNYPDLSCPGTKVLDYSVSVSLAIPPISGSLGKKVDGISADEVHWPEVPS